MKKLLLLSNGTVAPGGYLHYALPWIQDHFKASQAAPKTLLFIPYAQRDHESYAAKAAEALASLGIVLVSAHSSDKPVELLDDVQGVFVGGGNSFLLLDCLQKTGLLKAIKGRVEEGMPYMGASAGSNIAGPTIKTTNDMPIVQPSSFEAMGLVPFQINPHYVDGSFFYEEDGHVVPYNGETRGQRIAEFHQINATPVVGLREGTALRINDGLVELLGDKPAKLFQQGKEPVDIKEGEDLSGLFAGMNASVGRRPVLLEREVHA